MANRLFDKGAKPHIRKVRAFSVNGAGKIGSPQAEECGQTPSSHQSQKPTQNGLITENLRPETISVIE